MKQLLMIFGFVFLSLSSSQAKVMTFPVFIDGDVRISARSTLGSVTSNDLTIKP